MVIVVSESVLSSIVWVSSVVVAVVIDWGGMASVVGGVSISMLSIVVVFWHDSGDLMDWDLVVGKTLMSHVGVLVAWVCVVVVMLSLDWNNILDHWLLVHSVISVWDLNLMVSSVSISVGNWHNVWGLKVLSDSVEVSESVIVLMGEDILSSVVLGVSWGITMVHSVLWGEDGGASWDGVVNGGWNNLGVDTLVMLDDWLIGNLGMVWVAMAILKAVVSGVVERLSDWHVGVLTQLLKQDLLVGLVLVSGSDRDESCSSEKKSANCHLI